MKTIRGICQNLPLVRRRKGQSMVEMALIMPLFVLLIMGIIEFGWYVYTYSELNNAVRRGSEYAAKSPPATSSSKDDTTTDLCAKFINHEVKAHVFMHKLTDDNIRIVFPSGPEREIGKPIEVSVDYSGPWLTPLGNYLFDNKMHVALSSHRTIVNTAPPEGFNDGCTTS